MNTTTHPILASPWRTRVLSHAAATALALACVARPAAAVDPVGAASRQAVTLNPAISVVIDGVYYRSFGDEPAAHLREEMEGFGHGHAHDDHHHHAHGFVDGFNLREVEIMFAADVDPYFKAWTVVGVSEHDIELEEAVVLTTALPLGLQLKAGRFLSDINRQNASHPHDWNFADAPLIHELLLGDHGLNERGVQASWLAPTPFFLMLGFEALQGRNENLFAYLADEENPLAEHRGPRLFLGWAKLAPMLRGPHAFQVGVFAGRGVHQEAHLGPEGNADPGSHWLDGHQWLAGADFVYRYTPATAYGHRWLTLEGGYLYREKDIGLIAHNNPERAPVIGNRATARQDGFYVQGAYGFLPRWRLGLRGEMVGLVNEERSPSGSSEAHDASTRLSAMVDWTLTEFSRLRFQVNHGLYETHDGREPATEAFLQAVFSLGAHGAHRF